MRIIILLLFTYACLLAQDTMVDTTIIFEADPIVVTADRYESFKNNSTSAIAVVMQSEIELLPISRLSEVISTTPGLAFMHRDGLGDDPIVNVRGFYGGGEAEYLLILVDGKPLNNFESGLINWNSLPVNELHSIEILRGGNSSLYGDAAIGGVINIRTKRGNAGNTRFMLNGGSYNSYKGEFYTDIDRVNMYGSITGSDGFRDHGQRNNKTLGGSFKLAEAPDFDLSLDVINYWTQFEKPGPLSGSDLEDSPNQSSDYYKFDKIDEKKHKVSLDLDWNINSHVLFEASLNGESRKSDEITTLPLSPDFADTKNRILSTSKFDGSLNLVFKDLVVPYSSTLITGIDASAGSLSSDYYLYFLGGRGDYINASVSRGDLAESGKGKRKRLAAFFQYEVQPITNLRVIIGSRYDWLSDSYYRKEPSETGSYSTEHKAFSPKLGLNYRYLDNKNHRANLYINYSRSFKAPTLDQLYDQRSIPVSFPPYKITLSNDLLRPQKGKGGEIGFFHSFTLPHKQIIGEVSMSAYSMDMTDEIDFDLQQFKYINIGKSRHQGVETGVRLQTLPGLSMFVNYTYQAATSQYGPISGKYLKAIPRQIINGGFSVNHSSGLGGGVLIRSHQNIFLDDENTVTLPDYTVYDLKLSYNFLVQPVSLRLSMELLNIFDKNYTTMGFLDPAGTPGLVYYYPASERNMRAGIMMEF